MRGAAVFPRPPGGSPAPAGGPPSNPTLTLSTWTQPQILQVKGSVSRDGPSPLPAPITVQAVTVLLIYQLQIRFPHPSPRLQSICWSSSQNSEKHFLTLASLL